MSLPIEHTEMKKRNDTTLWVDWQHLPLVLIADHMHTTAPFIHADRTVDFHVLIYVLEGCICVCEKGQEYYVEEGQLLLLKAGIRHYGIHPTSEVTDWIYIHFSMDMPADDTPEFRPYSTHLQEQAFSKSDYAYKYALPKFTTVPPLSECHQKLNQLVDCFHSSDPLRGALLSPLLMQTLIGLYRDFPEKKENRYPHTVFLLIQYLESHTRTNFRTKNLEKAFHLSYKHLARIFKNATGRTLLEYHTELRMNEAAKLLRETNQTITEVSSFMGYEEPFYFTNVFRKIHGVSPRDYRRRFRQNY